MFGELLDLTAYVRVSVCTVGCNIWPACGHVKGDRSSVQFEPASKGSVFFFGDDTGLPKSSAKETV